jgi:hypothetical protein
MTEVHREKQQDDCTETRTTKASARTTGGFSANSVVGGVLRARSKIKPMIQMVMGDERAGVSE